MSETAAAFRVRTTDSSTLWRVELPRVPGGRRARVYYVTTYPDSDLMHVETPSDRTVSPITGRKLFPVLRAAIDAERAKP